MVAYSGEFDTNTVGGQFVLYAPSGVNSLNINYISGENPITVSGINPPPSPSSQDPGTNQTYSIQNPENGVVVNYQEGLSTIQWNWLS